MLNFNVEPYRDDFDPNKHFHRILFKPGRAVQARELTQSQTILQDQISKFAFHIFSQNTPVSGGNVTINKDCYYLRLLSEYDEAPIDVNDFLNRIIRDDTGTVLARVLAVAEETFVEDVSTEAPTLIVNYISGQHFDDGDVIYSADDSNFNAQLTASNSSGKSSVAHIAEGVFFVVNGYSYSNIQNPDGTYSKYSIGNFVGVQPQIAILDKYGNVPTLRVGLNINETIYDYIDDSSLLDPAVGASNYQAPGADRYVIELSLETRPLSIGDDQSFIELVRIENGEIKKQVNNTVYSVIDDYFAKRTSETNGNFVVNDFAFTPRANVNDANTYIMTVGKGVAYVNGYRVENQSDLGILGQRARTTQSSNNATVYFEYGNYFYVDNLQGFFDITKLPKVDIHCVPHTNVNLSEYDKTLIGSAYIRNLEQYSGDISDANTIVYKAFVTDIQTRTISGTAANTSSAFDRMWLQSGTYSTSANAYVGVSISITSGPSAGDTRTITESYSDGRIVVSSNFSELITNASNYTLKFGVRDAEAITLSTAPVSKTIRANINTTYGKERGFTTGYAKLIEPDEPEMIWPLGHSYVKRLTDTSYQGTYIYRTQTLQYSNNQLELYLTSPSATTFPGSGDLSVDQIKANFIISRSANGQILTFDSAARKITIEPTNRQSAKISISNLGNSSFDVDVISKINVNNGDATNILRTKELYVGNTSYYTTGTSVTGKANIRFNSALGQVYIPFAELLPITQIQSLYVCDVKQVRKIYETSSPAVAPNSTLTNVTDVTKYYTFNNGQKDSYYDHSYIQLNFGAPNRRGNLLVIFDYYEHSGDIGYFNIMSYSKGVRKEQYSEVLNAVYTAKNGDVYAASDSIDFRPTRKNADVGFVFDKDYIMPNYLTAFTGDYEYYLGRKDILILTKDKSFEIVQGVPAQYPKFPTIPDDSMDLAKISLDPYTSYITGENTKLTSIAIQKIVHKTWKMRNISDLEKRVNNIEYYTSLSLLEKNAQSLQIPDENGLNRFKYGILADDFTGFSVSDTANFDFNCAILKLERSLTASHTVENWKLQSSVLSRNMGALDSTLLSQFTISSNKTNKFFTLPFTKKPIIEQKLASRTINVNPVAVIDVVGDMDLSPPMDTYVDNLKLPSLMIADPAFKFYEPSDQANLLSQSDWKLIPGTTQEKLVNTTSVVDSAGGTTITRDFLKTWQESRDSLYGYYRDLNTNFIETNDFITDVNIMPFIRSQEIEFKTKGLLINTPLNCYFDGDNVNEYIRLPNLLRVSLSSGEFKEGDIIGYISSGVFYPTGKVLGVVYEPISRQPEGTLTTLSLRMASQLLYVVGDIGVTQYGAPGTNVIVAAVFNESGAYVRSTGSGLIGATLHSSGLMGTVAGGTSSIVDLYDDETGRDYSVISKAESLGQNNNVYLPKTLFKRTVRRQIGATSITLSSLASPTNDFYKNAIITVFNPNPINGEWASSAIISSYNGTTKVATLSSAINVEVSSATIYSIKRNTSIYITSVSTPLTVTRNNPVSFTEPMPVMSSINGMFCGIFKVPGGTFYSGSKVLRIDNGIDGNANSATTYAESVFYAANLATQSQSLQFASKLPGWTETDKVNKNSTRQEQTYIAPPPPPPPPIDPLGQSFIVEGNLYPNGVFLKSLSLFFRTRSIDSPVYIFIVETLNGYPTTNVLENSKVIVDPLQVNTSERPHYLDPLSKTTFEFDVPVYIKPDVLYAFVVKTSSIEYTCWLASQNDFALASTSKNLPTDPDPTTTAKLSSNPYVGTVFVSQNALTWTAEQTKSLMFTVDACEFDISKRPNIDFIIPKNAPRSKPIDLAIPYYNDNLQVIANTTNYALSSRNSIEYDKLNLSTSDFMPTQTRIDYSYDTTPKSTWLLTGTKTSINPGRYGTPSTDQYLTDGKGVRIIAGNSNNSFVMTAQLNSSNKWVSPMISDDGVSIYTTKWVINNLGVYAYNINIIDGGKNYSNTTTGVRIESTDGFGVGALADVEVDPSNSNAISRIILTNNGQNYAVRPKLFLSTLCSANTVSGNDNIIFRTTNGSISNGSIWYGQTISNGNSSFVTTVVSANNANGWVTVANNVFGTSTDQTLYIDGEPLLDNGRPAIVINCETCPGTGNGLSKYISKKVVLAPGDESGDLRVYYNAYRPLNTNIYVYYKLLSSEDEQKFEDGTWQLMTPIASTNRFSSTRTDLIEYIVAPGKNNIANNNISYTGISGEIYTSFNQFAIKVVMMTTDPTYVPFLADIRAIALPAGTGMV
jgi:hypothetical protein